MITIRPGSHVHRLLQLLSVAGEIPASALPLLGNGRSYSDLVYKLQSPQDIRHEKGGTVYRVRLIQVSGRKGERTIRLYRKGLPVLDGLYPGLLDLYLQSFRQHTFINDRSHIERNHRVAEAVAVCMAAGVETRQYALPTLQKADFRLTVPDMPSFYIARHIKKLSEDETSKTSYTRLVGVLFYPGGYYAAYNTREAVMKWKGIGEVKASGSLQELARMNAGLGGTPPALLFGSSADVALGTILESDKNRRPGLRFDHVYPNIHFVPLDGDGVRLLKTLVVPDWNEKLLGALFESSQRSYNKGAMEYDALVDGKMVLSHLDGDIARLIRFREAMHYRPDPAVVLCYPWQVGFLKVYLGGIAEIRELEMGVVEAALGV